MRKNVYKLPDYNDPLYFYQKFNNKYTKSDLVSEKNIKSVNWEQLSSKRRESWKQWAKICEAKGLSIINYEPHPESSPWALPVYARNKSQRNNFLIESWYNGFDWFSWPSLPLESLKSYDNLVDRWNKIICIPLNVLP